MIKLYIKKGLGFEERIFESQSCTVGRDDSCDLILSGKGLSRIHCKIQCDADSSVIEDLGSSNGTFVNGERIDGAHALIGGEKVSLGEDSFYFQTPPRIEDKTIFIKVLGGPDEGKSLQLGEGSVVLGRSDCDFTFPEDSGVSSRHVIIEAGDGGWVAKDLGSSNGLWVNQNRVEAVKLSQNHLFRIGKSLVFVGNQEELDHLQNKKELIARDMKLARKTPLIAAVALFVVAVAAIMWSPSSYRDARPNLLDINSSFELDDVSLPGWTTVLQAGLDMQISREAHEGDQALMFLGAQRLGDPVSHLYYSQDVAISESTLTFKASIKTNLDAGVVQMALAYRDADNNQQFLRGRSWCAQNEYAVVEDYFALPEGVGVVQPLFIFYGIEGQVLLDDVAIYEGGSGPVVRRVVRINGGDSQLVIGGAGSMDFYTSGVLSLAGLELLVKGDDSSGGSQTMGYLTSNLLSSAGSSQLAGVFYSRASNSFKPYGLKSSYSDGNWRITANAQGSDLLYGLRLVKAADILEAFAASGESMLISEGVQSQAMSELMVLNQPIQSLVRADGKSFLFTLVENGVSQIADVADQGLFPLSLLSYSPQRDKRIEGLLTRARNEFNSKNYAAAKKQALDIINRYPSSATAARKINDEVDKKAVKALAALEASANYLKVDMPEHESKIADFYVACRLLEAQFASLPAATQARILRQKLEAEQRAHADAKVNRAADKVVEAIRKAIAKDNFVLAGVLLGSLERQYPTSNAYAEIDTLRQQLKARQDLKKVEEAYIEGRYKEVINFQRNNLYGAIKRVYEDILVRYPEHAETKERLRLIEVKIKAQQ